MVKVDAGGNLIWLKTFDDGLRAYGHDISISSEGNYAALGITETDNNGNGHLNAYLVDPEGNLIWSKPIHFGAETYAYACAIEQVDPVHMAIMGVIVIVQPPQFSMEVRLKKIEM